MGNIFNKIMNFINNQKC